jgi:hypothetical protein
MPVRRARLAKPLLLVAAIFATSLYGTAPA